MPQISDRVQTFTDSAIRRMTRISNAYGAINLSQGTYFVMIDIQEFLDLPQFRGFTDLEFCEWMIKNIGVAAVPGSSFFRENVNHYIRLHFARSEETLKEALTRLERMKSLLP